MAIVSDDSVRSGSPHIEGTRITVLDLKRRVIDAGDDPHVVAGEYDISMAALFRALAYFYDHREQFAREERAYASERQAGEGRIQERIAEAADAREQAD